MTEQTTLPLAGGGALPVVGLGTWDVRGDAVYPLVRTAIDVGYRHIDTAHGYENQADIGAALRRCGIDRDELFLTSKIPPWQIGHERETLEASLTGLGTDHLDLWLIHAPPDDDAASLGLWEFLIGARESGAVRDIGVSNYSTAQIDALAAGTGVMPAVNQIRWRPEIFDAQVLRECRERGIVVEGFSALRQSDLADPTLLRIARRHNVTTAQVILRWQLHHDVVALPRSTRPGRIEENFALRDFELTGEEVAVIDAMSISLVP